MNNQHLKKLIQTGNLQVGYTLRTNDDRLLEVLAIKVNPIDRGAEATVQVNPDNPFWLGPQYFKWVELFVYLAYIGDEEILIYARSLDDALATLIVDDPDGEVPLREHITQLQDEDFITIDQEMMPVSDFKERYDALFPKPTVIQRSILGEVTEICDYLPKN